ncbi:MAG: helix-turn-helix transcriptional regulator [Microscillaceae bacterium]|nr:helix-turn-helix transcriptional regulator [Microscillaceae bacterium]
MEQEELDKKLLRIIIEERKKQGFNREEFSKKIDIPLGTLNDIEGGRTQRIPALFVLKACQVLGIDMSASLDSDEPVYYNLTDKDLGKMKSDIDFIKKQLQRQNKLLFDKLETDQKELGENTEEENNLYD